MLGRGDRGDSGRGALMPKQPFEYYYQRIASSCVYHTAINLLY